MSQFYIVSASNDQLAIQAANVSGALVLLEPLDTTNQYQLWEAELQIGGGWLGTAFYNPASQMAVTYNGEGQPLVMQQFSPNSGDRDSWYFTQGQQGGNVFRIALPSNNSWTWNIKGGSIEPGAIIQLYDDKRDNSLWTVVFAQ